MDEVLQRFERFINSDTGDFNDEGNDDDSEDAGDFSDEGNDDDDNEDAGDFSDESIDDDSEEAGVFSDESWHDSISDSKEDDGTDASYFGNKGRNDGSKGASDGPGDDKEDDSDSRVDALLQDMGAREHFNTFNEIILFSEAIDQPEKLNTHLDEIETRQITSFEQLHENFKTLMRYNTMVLMCHAPFVQIYTESLTNEKKISFAHLILAVILPPKYQQVQSTSVMSSVSEQIPGQWKFVSHKQKSEQYYDRSYMQKAMDSFIFETPHQRDAAIIQIRVDSQDREKDGDSQEIPPNMCISVKLFINQSLSRRNRNIYNTLVHLAIDRGVLCLGIQLEMKKISMLLSGNMIKKTKKFLEYCKEYNYDNNREDPPYSLRCITDHAINQCIRGYYRSIIRLDAGEGKPLARYNIGHTMTFRIEDTLRKALINLIRKKTDADDICNMEDSSCSIDNFETMPSLYLVDECFCLFHVTFSWHDPTYGYRDHGFFRRLAVVKIMEERLLNQLKSAMSNTAMDESEMKENITKFTSNNPQRTSR